MEMTVAPGVDCRINGSDQVGSADGFGHRNEYLGAGGDRVSPFHVQGYFRGPPAVSASGLPLWIDDLDLGRGDAERLVG